MSPPAPTARAPPLLEPWHPPSDSWPVDWTPIPEAYHSRWADTRAEELLWRIPANLPPNIAQFERNTIGYLERRITHRVKMEGNDGVPGTDDRVLEGYLVFMETRDPVLRRELRAGFEWARDEEKMLRQEAEEEGWCYDTCGDDTDEDEQADGKTGPSARELYAEFLEKTAAGVAMEDLE